MTLIRRMAANSPQCVQRIQWLSGSISCARLLAVVQETMQPAHVSLWLKPIGDRGRRTADGGQRSVVGSRSLAVNPQGDKQ